MPNNCQKGANCGKTCIDPNDDCTSQSSEVSAQLLGRFSNLIEQPTFRSIIGEGSSATVYETSNGTAYKKFIEPLTIGSIWAKEIDRTEHLGNLGIGPKLISVHEKDGKILGYEMEVIKGYQSLSSKGEWGVKDWLGTKKAASAIEAIAKLHSEGYVHNDLSSGNILVKGKNARLIDFGISSKIEDNPQNLTRELFKFAGKNGQTVGTRAHELYAYMADWEKTMKGLGNPSKAVIQEYTIGLKEILEDTKYDR